ncbi:hypothetical protein M9H77_07530 [Catharanthus roseus]|uniref:Uncharacterized protein n=1 Tax=Catharanthus roseus TaxID=4058 RepID=A0ACC0BV57_CATRO|nr:hypothetical protein M9H77_07530 [Catharanthus roseus]
MDDMDRLSEVVDENLDFIEKCFEEVLSGLEDKGKELEVEKESVAGKFKEVDSTRESVEARCMQVREKEKEFELIREKGLRDFELKKKEVDLILEGVKDWEVRFNEQEKLVKGFLQRIELGIKKFEVIQKSMGELFDALSQKERQVEDRSTELNLISNEIERKTIELHKKEEDLERCKRKFELREKALSLERQKLVAREKEIEARELDFGSRMEELRVKENELELRERILNMRSKEANEAANLVDDGEKQKQKMPKIDAADPRKCKEERRTGKKRARMDNDNELSIPRERIVQTNIAEEMAVNKVRVEYADPEFHDFDEDKNKSCFAVDQFWACYDEVDAMPRFYLQINKVYSRKFKVNITWLEVDPEYRLEVDSFAKDLPVSCGKFICGDSEDITDIHTFSHQIRCEEDSHKGFHVIYPKTGEIWALFKDLDIRKKSDFGSIQGYEYEIVVVLSDFVEKTGIRVAYLDKLEGYVSLFHRKKESTAFPIRPDQLFKFSHQIPSYRMNGTEREGVPEGCFELDPACLPPPCQS